MNTKIELYANRTDGDIVTLSLACNGTKIEDAETFYNFVTKKQWKEVATFAVELLLDVERMAGFDERLEVEKFIIDQFNFTCHYFKEEA